VNESRLLRCPRLLSFLPPHLLLALLLFSAPSAVQALSPDGGYLRGILTAEGFDFQELAGADGTAAVLTVTIPARASGAREQSPGVFILAIPSAYSGAGAPENPGAEARELPDGTLSLGLDTGIRFIKNMQALESGRKIVTAFLMDAPGEAAASLEVLYRTFVTTAIIDTTTIIENNENTLLVYLDVPDGADGIGIYHGTRGAVAPLSLIRSLPTLLAAHGISCAVPGSSNARYRLGLAAGSPVLEFARAGELPAIELRSLKTAGEIPLAVPGEFPENSPSISAGELAGFLADYAETVETGIGTSDTNYTTINYRGQVYFISEGVTVLLLILSIGIVLALVLLKKREIHVRRQWGDICGNIALGLTILELLGVTFLDTSWTLLLIWAMGFTVMGSMVRYPPLVFSAAILAPLTTAVFVINGDMIGGDIIGELFRNSLSGGMTFYRLTTASLRALILGGAILPFALLICRGILLIRRDPQNPAVHSAQI
jgi:hypothetical protein